MKTSNIQNIHAKSAAKGAAPRLPEASSRAYAVKQITEQLELALEHIYQLTLDIPRKAKRTIKKIPQIPGYIQLLLDFTSVKTNKTLWQKVVEKIQQYSRKLKNLLFAQPQYQ
jgi:hypothetical protein